jgi:hypothetical protein
MQLTDWLLVEVALLLIGLTEISLTKTSFNHPSVIESLLIGCHLCNVQTEAHSHREQNKNEI